MTDKPPAGFERHDRRSPVTDPWEPIYARRAEEAVELGLFLGPQHCNSRGLAHGGVIAALADNAMGLSCATAMTRDGGDVSAGLVTVSLTVDYLSAGRIGGWLAVAPRVLRATGSMGFADAIISVDGKPIARSSATFRRLDRRTEG